jgi:hypothetical protein
MTTRHVATAGQGIDKVFRRSLGTFFAGVRPLRCRWCRSCVQCGSLPPAAHVPSFVRAGGQEPAQVATGCPASAAHGPRSPTLPSAPRAPARGPGRARPALARSLSQAPSHRCAGGISLASGQRQRTAGGQLGVIFLLTSSTPQPPAAAGPLAPRLLTPSCGPVMGGRALAVAGSAVAGPSEVDITGTRCLSCAAQLCAQRAGLDGKERVEKGARIVHHRVKPQTAHHCDVPLLSSIVRENSRMCAAVPFSGGEITTRCRGACANSPAARGDEQAL